MEQENIDLHEGNVPMHSALSVKQFPTDKQIPLLKHPPYYPDLSSAVIYLIPEVENVLKLGGGHKEKNCGATKRSNRE